MASLEIELRKACTVVGVALGASQESLTIAYRKMAFVYHPDVTKLPQAQATEKMKALNAAYDLLKEHGIPRAPAAPRKPSASPYAAQGGEWVCPGCDAGIPDEDMMRDLFNEVFRTATYRAARSRSSPSSAKTEFGVGGDRGMWFYLKDLDKWGVMADSGLSGQFVNVYRKDGTHSVHRLGKVAFDKAHSVYEVVRRQYARSHTHRSRPTADQIHYAQAHQAPTDTHPPYKWMNADGSVTYL